MNEPKEETTGWWLLAVLAGAALGWWLAIRTLAIRVSAAAAAVLAGPELAAEEITRPSLSLKDRADDYLTVKELEKYVPLCGKSIRKEIDEGRLPSHRMRGKVTVKGSDALAWLSARKES